MEKRKMYIGKEFTFDNQIITFMGYENNELLFKNTNNEFLMFDEMILFSKDLREIKK